MDTRAAGANAVAMTLEHPTTEEPLTDDAGNPWTITLYGSDSEVYRKAQRKIVDRRLAEAKAKGGKFKMNANMAEEELTELLVECTAGWSGLEENGAPIEFNTANVRGVYARYPWIREQAMAFVSTRSNYLGNS